MSNSGSPDQGALKAKALKTSEPKNSGPKNSGPKNSGPKNSGHRARKRFGQNFLQDTHIIERIIAAISPTPGDQLVEIGPGLGALTIPLIKAAGRISAVELDRDLVSHLQQEFPDDTLTIHNADVLSFDFNALADTLDNTNKLRVIGNLPYNISTPLLFKLLQFLPRIKDMHFMLQKEVVDRITAVPGTKVFGRLSVMMQYYCEAEALLDVPPTAFSPAPKVWSSILRLTPRQDSPYPNVQFESLEQATRQAFSNRRKTLRNNFRNSLSVDTLTQAGFDAGCRAETLDIPAFVNLANLLAEHSGNPTQ